MAITRRWQSGAETGSITEVSRINGTFSVQATPYTGTYSFRDFNIARGYVDIPATRQARIGLFLRGHENASRYTIVFADSGDNKLVGLRWKDDASVELLVGGVVRDTEVGMNIGQNWMHIGLDVKIDSSSGWAKVYADSQGVMDYAGNTGNADITYAAFGHFGDQGASYQIYYDDIYVDDTTGEGTFAVCPVLRFFYVVPNGVGNYSQWNPSAGNNYECVDEVPPSSADYVQINVVDQLDSYAMDTHTLGAGQTIEAVIPIVSAARQDASEEIAVGTRLSGTDLIGSDQTPGIAYDNFWERQTTKPGGGAWAQADVDAFEALIKSRGSY